MSQNRLTWDGLEELRAELRQLPADLAREAGYIVQAEANGAAVAIRTAYGQHRRSGQLQDGVTVEHAASPFGARSIVRSTAPEARVFEVGSQARHTSLGANRGSMPPGNVFYPAIHTAQRSMWVQLKDLLVRHGLSVSGTEG